MTKPNLTQIIVAILATGFVMAGPARADDTAQLKQQVQDLQTKVNQLEAQLADQQQAPAVGQAYDQWQDPFAQMMRMQRQMERRMQAMNNAAAFNPRMDMRQTDKEYIITMDLPGMDKNKINVETKEDMLIISGERRSEVQNNTGTNNQYYRQERSFGSFMQAIPLPDDAKKDQIDANYKNGVLTVTIPRVKKEEQKPEGGKIIVK